VTSRDDGPDRLPSEIGAVPFSNFRRAIAGTRPELDAAIARVLERGWLILGPEVEAFEAELARFAGAEGAVGCGSGTDAIELALRALGVGAGDEVVTQANTCVPTVAAIARTGATPVLCDVEPDAATMDPESLERVIGPRTRAVVPVHLYGQVGAIDEICEVASRRNIPVVEDCAQAIGAKAHGRSAGTFGAAGCFSFYPTKNLGALGDGGAVVSSDPELIDRMRKIRVYGQAARYEHLIEGINSRLDEIQAAVLSAKLPDLEPANARRRRIASAYREALRGTGLRPLDVLADREHAFHLFVVQTENRERVRAGLAERGIETLVHYPIPIHLQPAYRQLADGAVSLSVSERQCEGCVSLPIYPELSDAEVAHVAAMVAELTAE